MNTSVYRCYLVKVTIEMGNIIYCFTNSSSEVQAYEQGFPNPLTIANSCQLIL